MWLTMMTHIQNSKIISCGFSLFCVFISFPSSLCPYLPCSVAQWFRRNLFDLHVSHGKNAGRGGHVEREREREDICFVVELYVAKHVVFSSDSYEFQLERVFVGVS